jgi:hypothetical protein
MFRYPEYYLIKKVTIGRAFDNMENFLSVHWIFNIFSCAVMNLYFVKEFIIKTFKIKKTKIEYLIIIILGLISIYIPTIIIENSTQELELMRYKFPNMIGLPIIGFLLISIIIILIKKILRKT